MEQIKILKDAMDIWQRRYRSFGDYSATTLLNPPRMVQLQKRHPEAQERTVASQLAAFIGSGVHNFFEEMLRYKAVIEPRYELERTVMDKVCDRVITGKFDILWNERHLYDNKTTKVWKVVFDPGMEEWHKQLNIYAHLLRSRGLEIRSLNIIAVYLDWQKQRAFRGGDNYPNQPVMEYELTMWEPEVAARFLCERVNVMKAAEEIADDALPWCTREEIWQRHENGAPVIYAVMSSPDAPRASKLCDTEEEARQYALDRKMKEGAFIEARYASAKRCEEYCSVRSVCNQYAEYLEKRNSKAELNERIEI